jgi:hypothetical protein
MCRDSSGALIVAATWEKPGPEDPLLAEAFALYNAIHLAKDRGFHEVLFESDCSQLISLINSPGDNPRTYVGNAIKGIRSVSTHFRSCRFTHIQREANRAAHLLASMAYIEFNKVWIDEVPPPLVTTLSLDSIH